MSDTKKAARSCANCQHWQVKEASGDGFHSLVAPCAAPMPVSLVGVYWLRKVKASAGTECPAHRMRVKRQPKLKLAQQVAA